MTSVAQSQSPSITPFSTVAPASLVVPVANHAEDTYAPGQIGQGQHISPWNVRQNLNHVSTRLGLRKPAEGDLAMGPVGSAGGGALAGGLAGLVIGGLIWGTLGITALAVTKRPYHSDLRGILFLAIGIPVFVVAGALIGAGCGGGSGRKDLA